MPFTTGDNNFGVAKWIVDPVAGQGTHTTISAAITAASSGQTIFIRPGTYTENLTLKAGVNLTAFDCDALTPNVTIIGKCTFTGAGTVSISGIRLQTNSDLYLAVTGSSASIVNLSECYLNASNNTGLNFTSSNSSAQLNLYQCLGDLGTTGIAHFVHSSAGTFTMDGTVLNNSAGSTTANTQSAGLFFANYSDIRNPFTCSSTGQFGMVWTQIFGSNTTAITQNSSNESSCRYCRINSGTAVPVTASGVIFLFACEITSSNGTAVSGSGQCIYSGNIFYNGTGNMTISTQSPQDTGPRISLATTGIQILGGSGNPNGSVTAPKGSLWLRTNGSSTSTRAYINTDSSTTWTNIVTGA